MFRSLRKCCLTPSSCNLSNQNGMAKPTKAATEMCGTLRHPFCGRHKCDDALFKRRSAVRPCADYASARSAAAPDSSCAPGRRYSQAELGRECGQLCIGERDPVDHRVQQFALEPRERGRREAFDGTLRHPFAVVKSAMMPFSKRRSAVRPCADQPRHAAATGSS